jgi:GNAT superfamily N-acetyltransferase
MVSKQRINRDGQRRMSTSNGSNVSNNSWVIDLFQPEDAAGVVDIYRAIYGGYFPMPEIYNAVWHIKQAQSKDSLRVVARLPDGRIIGTAALFRAVRTNIQLYESGGLMVRQEYRNQNIATQLAHYIYNSLQERYAIGQIWAEAVCNHLISQRLSIENGYTACALELDIMSENVSEKFSGSNTAHSLVSELVVFKAYNHNRRLVYLPAAYEDVLTKLYAPFQFGHQFLIPGSKRVAESSTNADIDSTSYNGLTRISVTQIGTDFTSWLDRTDNELKKSESMAYQVILPLDTPLIDPATEILRNKGYWLGGLLPRWFGHDGLLMQKTLHEPDFSKIKVYSQPGEAVLAMVEADYKKRRR